MRKMRWSAVAACLAVLVMSGVSQAANVLQIGITGNIQSENTYAGMGDWMKVEAVADSITSYFADPSLPQVGSDLSQFGWAMDGNVTSVNWNGPGGTVTYLGNWSIVYLPTQEVMEKGQFDMTAVFTDGSNATVTGLLVASSDYNFTWTAGPAAGTTVDWSSIGTANLDGTFDGETLNATVSAGVTAVPVPAAAWAGMTLLGGMGGVAGLKRKLRRA